MWQVIIHEQRCSLSLSQYIIFSQVAWGLLFIEQSSEIQPFVWFVSGFIILHMGKDEMIKMFYLGIINGSFEWTVILSKKWINIVTLQVVELKHVCMFACMCVCIWWLSLYRKKEVCRERQACAKGSNWPPRTWEPWGDAHFCQHTNVTCTACRGHIHRGWITWMQHTLLNNTSSMGT